MIATSSLELDQVWSTSSLELPPLQGVAARPPTVGELVEAMDEELIVIHLVNASGAPPARTRALLVLSTALSSERGGAPVRPLALQMRSDVTSTKPIEPDFFQGWGAVPGFNGVGEWPHGVDASFFGRAECDLSFGGAKMPLQLAGGSAQLVTYTLWAATTASPPRDAPGEVRGGAPIEELERECVTDRASPATARFRSRWRCRQDVKRISCDTHFR